MASTRWEVYNHNGTLCFMVLFKPVGADFIFLHFQVGSKTKNTIVYNPQQRIFIPDKFPPALSSGALTEIQNCAVFNRTLLGKNRARLHEILVKNTEELPILVGQSKHRARADEHSISPPSSAGCLRHRGAK